MLNDSLASALSMIKNAEKRGKKEVVITPTSTIIQRVLKIMNELGYVGSFEKHGLKSIKLNLLSKINNCGVIKPQYQIRLTEFEKFEKRYLLAAGFGVLIISTNEGILTSEEAKERKIGGKLLSYVY